MAFTTRFIRLLTMTMLSALAGHTPAAGYSIASMRLIGLSSPWSPTSADECSALSQKFSEIIQQLNAEHDECLKDAPRDDHGGGTCSKVACQGLHTDRDNASRKASEEGRVCQERLRAYLEKKRQDEAEERRRKEATEQREREAAQERARLDREQAQKESQRKADRDRRKQEDKSAQDKRDREDRDRRDRDAKADADRREKEELANAEQRAQDARDNAARYEREARMAELRAQAEAERSKKLKSDQLAYEKELQSLRDLRSVKDKVLTGIEFVNNPFEKGVEMLEDKAKEELEGISHDLVSGTVDSTLPGREKRDNNYDKAVDVVEKARSKALAGNPFAEKASGVAMEGVNKMHRKVLGHLDNATQAIEHFEQDAAPSAHAPAPLLRASPAPRGGGESTGQTAATYSANNPFVTQARAATYYDPDTRQTLDVPTGYVLYRAPETNQLTVVSYAQVSASPATGDRPELGEKGCGATGVGIVTPECEKKRRTKANPFVGK